MNTEHLINTLLSYTVYKETHFILKIKSVSKLQITYAINENRKRFFLNIMQYCVILCNKKKYQLKEPADAILNLCLLLLNNRE